MEANDTLTSVAARFDTTPSELAKLNRLPQRMPLFPGQVLYIPAERAAGRPPPGGTSDPGNSEQPQQRRTSDSATDDTSAPGTTTAAGATDLPYYNLTDGAADQERGNKWLSPSFTLTSTSETLSRHDYPTIRKFYNDEI